MDIKKLEEIFSEVDDNKKEIVRSMFDDFIHEHELIEQYKPQIKALSKPKNKGEADKLKYYSKLYSDVSQRHDSKIKIFLSTLSKFESEDEDDFMQFRSALDKVKK